MDSKPRVLIHIYIFNSEGSKILMGKRYDDGSWGSIAGKLINQESFEEAAVRVLSSSANILVEEYSRIKQICTYNSVDLSSNFHIVSIDFYIQISSEEEKEYLIIDPYFFQTWGWYSWEEIKKIEDNLYRGMKTFLKKFKIQNLDDIKSLVSN